MGFNFVKRIIEWAKNSDSKLLIPTIFSILGGLVTILSLALGQGFLIPVVNSAFNDHLTETNFETIIEPNSMISVSVWWKKNHDYSVNFTSIDPATIMFFTDTECLRFQELISKDNQTYYSNNSGYFWSIPKVTHYSTSFTPPTSGTFRIAIINGIIGREGSIFRSNKSNAIKLHYQENSDRIII